ncbi:hypothetical protein GCM10010532_097030 [Dactylosporangium siamense]|uniref:WD40 repeat domain-containing protein n=1 Tax=Dactylosporangium siamense TaxID=685454 RepID=A0A919PTN3_9ACTN|nr:hypothetical protein Dsi01nite_080350 [Dactylosporangium siamense]
MTAVTCGTLSDGRFAVVTGHQGGSIVVRDLSGSELFVHAQQSRGVTDLRLVRLPSGGDRLVVLNPAYTRSQPAVTLLDPLRDGPVLVLDPDSVRQTSTIDTLVREDGQVLLATRIGGQDTKVFDVETGELLLDQPWRGGFPHRTGVALAEADGVAVVAGLVDFKRIDMWAVPSGDLVHTTSLSSALERQSAQLVAGTLSDGGAVIAYGSATRIGLILPAGAERQHLPTIQAGSGRLLMVPMAAGPVLAVCGHDAVTLIHLPSGDVVGTVPARGVVAQAAARIDGSTRLVTLDRSGVVNVWSLSTAATLTPAAEFRLEGKPARLMPADLPDGRLAIAARVGDETHIIDDDGTHRGRIDSKPHYLGLFRLPNGNTGMLSSTSGAGLTVHDLTDGRSLRGAGAWVSSCAALTLDDGTTVALRGTAHKTAGLVPLDGEPPVRQFPRPGIFFDGFVCVSRLLDGRQVAVAGNERLDCAVWDVATGEHLAVLAGANHESTRPARLPDGRAGAVRCAADGIHMWDLETGRHRAFPVPSSEVVEATAVVRYHGEVAAVRPAGRAAELWSLADGRLLHSIEHPTGVVAVTSSADQTRLITVDASNVARTWIFASDAPRTAPRRHEITPVPGPDDTAYKLFVADHPDGASIVVDMGSGLIAFHAESMAVRWTRPLRRPAGTCVAAMNGHFLVKELVGFSVLDAGDGTQVSRQATVDGHRASMTVFDPRGNGDVIYGSTDSGLVFRLTVPGGVDATVAQSRERPHSLAAGRAADGGLLLAIGSRGPQVTVFDGDLTRQVLTHTFDGSAKRMPLTHIVTVSGRPVLLATLEGADVLTAVGMDGETLWTARHEGVMAMPSNALTSAAVPGRGDVVGWLVNPGTVLLIDPADGAALHTLAAPQDTPLRAIAMWSPGPGRVAVAAISNGRHARSPQVLVWRLELARTEAAVNVDPPRLWAAARGVAVAASAGWWLPLGAALEAVRLIDGAAHELAGVRSLQLLRGLGWPLDARVGLALLLLAGHGTDPALAPPTGADAAELLAELIREARTVRGSAQVYVRTVDEHDDEFVERLRLVGADAVAADPLLPLRLRDSPAALAHRPVRTRFRVGGRRTVEASTDAGAGTDGVVRGGPVSRVLHSELALPADVFRVRWLRGETLYRRLDTRTPQALGQVTMMLDVSPATAGPVEGVLRAVAHTLTVAMWAAGGRPWLVVASRPEVRVAIDGGAGLTGLWTVRSLDPADHRGALKTAGLGGGLTVALVPWRAVHSGHVRPGPDLRVVTTHAADDPPSRAPASVFHKHLRPDADARTITAAVEAVMAYEHTERTLR